MPQAQETIRTALAMGADRGILIETDVDVEPLAVAKLLKAMVDEEKPKPDASWASRRSTTTTTQIGQMLAALLGWPQATFASRSRSTAARPR